MGVVVGVALVGYWAMGGRGETPPAGGAGAGATTAPATATARDFYFHVKLVEAKPTSQGKRWDPGSDDAPDLYCRILYQGKVVHESPERSDSLIAEWDLFRVNLRDVIGSGGKVDVASMIAAPLVHSEPGATAVVEVYDDDAAGDDDVAKVTVPLDALAGGERVLTGGEKDNYARIVLQIVPRDTPVDELVELQRKR